MLLICESDTFALARATCTAGVHRRRVVQIFETPFCLPHTCCFDAGRCGCVCHRHIFKSFAAFRGVSPSRRRQSGTVNFAGWASRRATKLFKVSFADVDVAGSSAVAVVVFCWSRFNVWQLWDDQQWLRQICRNIAWVRLPRRSTDTLQQSVVVSLLFWDSSHRLDNGPSLVHLVSNLCRVRFG